MAFGPLPVGQSERLPQLPRTRAASPVLPGFLVTFPMEIHAIQQ